MINVFPPGHTDTISRFYDGSSGKTPLLPFAHTIESLNRNVYPKPLHSHNDYWRLEPLFDALSVGCVSIESDVWHFPDGYKLERTETVTTGGGMKRKVNTSYFKENEIYVGHNQVYLEPINTLFNMYLNPIFQFLEYSNPNFTFLDSSKQGSPYLEDHGLKHGIFYNSPETPLYLWMDVKNEPNSTYDAVRPLLQPFIDNNYLAYYNTTSDKYIPGPVVITFTGNLPVQKVKEETIRYTFLDGPLKEFTSDADEASIKEWSKLSKVASASLQDLLGEEYPSSTKSEFSESQKARLKRYFDKAHQYGMRTRIWGDIIWPNNLAKAHIEDFYKLGSDLLNVDDVHAAADYF